MMRNYIPRGTMSAMKSTILPGKGLDRKVPSWAAGIVGLLSRDLPTVLTRSSIADWLAEAGSNRPVDSAITELRRLGWLVSLPVHGAWGFVPPGQEHIVDNYLPLRAWQAQNPHTGFMLAGSAAAWHLGYLDREPGAPTSIWLRQDTRLPDGLRQYVSVVKTGWDEQTVKLLGPTTKLLLRRKLDLTRWSNGLPAFGPEALLVQLSARPSSFQPWADLIAHLDQLVDDCDDSRIEQLLASQSTSAWQRASYLIHAGGRPERGLDLLSRRPRQRMPKVRFELAGHEPSSEVWIPEYQLIDALINPLQRVLGKA